MKEMQNLVYGIVGLGLMGGSLAKAIRKNILSIQEASGKILGADINASVRERTLSDKICDSVYPMEKIDEMLSVCDFVYICLYPHTTLEFLRLNRDNFKSGSIITDISGVKLFLFNSLGGTFRDDVDFISGHPMAGGEKEGYVNSSGSIFENHNYIILPSPQNNAENVELFKLIIKAMGFSRIVTTDARVHDHKIAFTSQLCHVIASALVDSAEDTSITAFGGGSFEDLTRIAMINAPLWTELFLADKEELLAHITSFENSLKKLKDAISADDSKAIQSYLENVRAKRIAMTLK